MAGAPFDIYTPFARHRYGISLSFLSRILWGKWERFTREPNERLEWLAAVKRFGIGTWVSVEPVVDVEEALAAIEAAAPWADEFRLGKLNHMAEVERTIDWREYGQKAVGLCERLGKRYFVKRDLARYLDLR
jgi:DNA repair photolyase